MNDFKGTRGPWELDYFGNVVHGRADGWGRKEGVRVNGVVLPGRVTPEYQANTNLVAAAPELLEALQHIMEMQLRGFIVLGETATGKANSAIAKALGQ